jgi:hypothetical protein
MTILLNKKNSSTDAPSTGNSALEMGCGVECFNKTQNGKKAEF